MKNNFSSEMATLGLKGLAVLAGVSFVFFAEGSWALVAQVFIGGNSLALLIMVFIAIAKQRVG